MIYSKWCILLLNCISPESCPFWIKFHYKVYLPLFKYQHILNLFWILFFCFSKFDLFIVSFIAYCEEVPYFFFEAVIFTQNRSFIRMKRLEFQFQLLFLFPCLNLCFEQIFIWIIFRFCSKINHQFKFLKIMNFNNLRKHPSFLPNSIYQSYLFLIYN